MPAPETLDQLLKQCVRCGACQAHCPVYLETGSEGSVARGKIVLAQALLDGNLDLEGRLTKEIGLCLLCGSCTARCPNQVETERIVAELRERISGEQGLSVLARGVAALTGSKRLITPLLAGAGLLSPLLFKKIPAASGLQLRFSPAGLKGRSLPPIPGDTLFDRVPPLLAGDPGRPTLGVFAGCALTFLFPGVGENLVRLLNDLGYSVVLPKSQACCGMPAMTSGNGPLRRQLAEANRLAFRDLSVDLVLTACASCHGMLTRHYGRSSREVFGAELVDVHLFLSRIGLRERLAALPRWNTRPRVCYHDPCHLRNQAICRQPRELLQALPQAEYTEMEDASLCCGLGGTFSAVHPELSRAIGDRKAAGLASSRAELVATGCPGCMLQLQDIIDRAGLPMRAVHTLDLIRQALEGPKT